MEIKNINKLPLISVILPAYNAEKFIKEAIDSILKQTYTNFEFIIINDCSTDKTEEIILSYSDKRIKYVKHKKNLQLIKTLNEAIEMAKGKYIARMDADDISLPQRLEKEFFFLERNQDIDIVSCFPINISMNGKILCKSSYFNCTRPESCKFVSIFEPPILHPGCMFRADMIRKYQYKDQPEFYHIEAYELWNRLMLGEGIKGAMLPEYLLQYRNNSNSITHVYIKEQWERHLNLLEKTLSKYFNIFEKKEVLLCIITKTEVDKVSNIESAFNLLDRSYATFFYNNPNIEKKDINEIINWCNQKKLAILLTSLLASDFKMKIKIFYKLIQNYSLLFSVHNLIYIKNRINRIFNERTI